MHKTTKKHNKKNGKKRSLGKTRSKKHHKGGIGLQTRGMKFDNLLGKLSDAQFRHLKYNTLLLAGVSNRGPDAAIFQQEHAFQDPNAKVPSPFNRGSATPLMDAMRNVGAKMKQHAQAGVHVAKQQAHAMAQGAQRYLATRQQQNQQGKK